jgi:heme/copper-type cytochrome/quinol oxidase subunit 3
MTMTIKGHWKKEESNGNRWKRQKAHKKPSQVDQEDDDDQNKQINLFLYIFPEHFFFFIFIFFALLFSFQ